MPEKVFYEDQEFATIPLCYAKKVATSSLILYQYLIGNSSQSISNHNKVQRIEHLEIVISHMLRYWKQNHEQPHFSSAFFLNKMEGIVLSYYVIMCLINDSKVVGRKACRSLNQHIHAECPQLYKIVHRHYLAYSLFSHLHISEELYQIIIHSPLFRLIRHNHKIEEEKQNEDMER